MKEIYPNIYRTIIEYDDQAASPQNLYILRQQERSLLIDTSYRFARAWETLNQMIIELDIDYKKLDVFITHNHPDHIGYVHELQQLGARIFMNPVESELKTDILQSYLSTNGSTFVNLRAMGVTKEIYPEDYDMLVRNMSKKLVEREELYGFDFLPIHPGDELEYGEYHFEVLDLKGHSLGQCGLYDKEHKILFSGDQIMEEIVPIAITQKRNQNLLRHYIDSLNEIKERYNDCLILPCHYGIVKNPKAEAERILSSYNKLCHSILELLKKEDRWMVTRAIGVDTHGGKYRASHYKKIMMTALIWAKTFSCLEYLYEKGLVDRKEENGIIYWRYKI